MPRCVPAAPGSLGRTPDAACWSTRPGNAPGRDRPAHTDPDRPVVRPAHRCRGEHRPHGGEPGHRSDPLAPPPLRWSRGLRFGLRFCWSLNRTAGNLTYMPTRTTASAEQADRITPLHGPTPSLTSRQNLPGHRHRRGRLERGSPQHQVGETRRPARPFQGAWRAGVGVQVQPR